MNPTREKELLEHYEELIDEMFEFKIGEMEYSAVRAWKAIDPEAFQQGFNEYVDMVLEEEEYEESGEWEKDRQRLKERSKEREAIYGGPDDSEPSIDFKMPPKKFQCKREWQKVNKSWSNVLKKK